MCVYFVILSYLFSLLFFLSKRGLCYVKGFGCVCVCVRVGGSSVNWFKGIFSGVRGEHDVEFISCCPDREAANGSTAPAHKQPHSKLSFTHTI